MGRRARFMLMHRPDALMADAVARRRMGVMAGAQLVVDKRVVAHELRHQGTGQHADGAGDEAGELGRHEGIVGAGD